MYNIEVIAKVCHQAHKALCQAFGDDSQKDWDNAEDWQRESAMFGVQFALDNPNGLVSGQHDAWMEHKLKDGWTYGEVKDAENKKHPCLVPFEELPPEQQAKDFIFKAIVNSFK